MRLIAVFGGMLVACVVLEVALRCTWDRDLTPKTINTFKRGKYYTYNEAHGWRPKPNVRGMHEFFNANFTTNSRGLRGSREYTVPRPRGIRRVVIVGDSFAWGFGVEDDEIFTAVLEQKLPNTEVINLGVTGYQLPSELRYLKDTGMSYKPDVVLIALCQNDLCASPHGPFVRVKKEQSTDSRAAASLSDVEFFKSLKAFLYQSSYAYAACVDGINANKTLARAAVRLGLKEKLAGFEALDINLHAAMLDYPPQVQASVEQAKMDLLQFDVLARTHGARLLIALIPSLQAVDRRALVRSIAYTEYDVTDFDVDKPYRTLERFAAEQHITVCNPVDRFRQLHRAGERLFLRKDMHLSASGHRAFANVLDPILRTMLDADQVSLKQGGPGRHVPSPRQP